ncbi:BZ3500_MvSof-1268-A1-R1_Chr3-1g05553 [Microbotryum saponariae]|uniref:BZ3500_MvSof-1268-A1-R1_Chr3-1g05553 protein n=1 Tax=Microbotryum saponariae TaxID=289078 RepID=A0A2X0LIA5_9BASI|nr:BZ3500_MvSof-1268-A1-R1_Chr3-1g05553 [Microbotryum saponariae]
MAAACSIATDSTIPFNTVFFECQPSSSSPSAGDTACVTLSPKGGGGGGGGGGHPPWPAWENDIDSNKYHMFYNKAREGSCNGRKVAKSYATPLPVNVDGHVKLYMHTISRGPPVKGTRSLSSLTDSESKLKGSNGVFAGEERLLKGLRPRDAAAPRARTSVRPVGSRSSLPLRCKQPPYPLLCKVVSHPLLRARANFSRLALSRLAVSS